VEEKSVARGSRRLRALYDWFRGAKAPAPRVGGLPSTTTRLSPERIGPYTVVGKLGEGGMGIVYAARDERLERTVAVKVMSLAADDETARRRFLREARTAASVNHPNVCQLYEIGEDDSGLFIAMELLEGESLAARLKRGPLSVGESLPVGLGMLAALSALHARGIVHRDLKPSNVFLTPHGVKVLDFGLARPTGDESATLAGSAERLTRTGMLIGTPGYIAPERVTAEQLDARSDLFAVGAILFEMLAGRPAFRGANAIEILHAVLHEQPPALTGSPAAAAMDRVIRRALAKRPSDRPRSADEMAEALRAAGSVEGTESRTLVQAMTRLVVLPFRVLRSDPETDFLAFSLPDAIATSLSGIGSLVVRSGATAARFAGDAPDLKALAAEADVDRVVMGTVLRSGDMLRATAQLVDAPGGALVTSQTVQASLGDLFRLQDDLARRVVDALALPLGVGGGTPTPVPPDDRAYLIYLQANEAARTYDQLPRARELYQRCLEVDPGFAPAWAGLGRCHWVIGRYFEDSGDSDARAADALHRALELNPRLAAAHKLHASLEAGTGRAQAALARLLEQAERHGTDPELFAGLVQVCRYCGLFDQAVAAHEEARRLDPNVPTSIGQTLLMKGDLDRLLARDPARTVAGGDDPLRAIASGLSGDRVRARREIVELRRTAGAVPGFLLWADFLIASFDRSAAGMEAALAALGGRKIMEDPEAIFQCGWLLCDGGSPEPGMEHLQRAVARGYHAAPTLAWSGSFDAVRGRAEFRDLQAAAEGGCRRGRAGLRQRGGERLLGAIGAM
jgi:serine/threonine protein kinase/tetratricopeptide (TPR) repeat protein